MSNVRSCVKQAADNYEKFTSRKSASCCMKTAKLRISLHFYRKLSGFNLKYKDFARITVQAEKRRLWSDSVSTMVVY